MKKYPYFLGEPVFKFHPSKKRYFIVYKPFEFHINELEYCVIPTGSIVNGASIPWIFRCIFDLFDPRYNLASVLHDALVGEGGQPKVIVKIDGGYRSLTWKESAVWFRTAMRVCTQNFKNNDTAYQEYNSSSELKNRFRKNIIDKSDSVMIFLFYQAVMLKKRPKQWISVIFD